MTMRTDGLNEYQRLEQQNVILPVFCNGKGNCGRCKVCAVAQATEGMDILGVEHKYYDTKYEENGIGIAVDVGTTTLVIAAIDLQDGHCIGETKVANPQRMYGTDVLSRIQSCAAHGVATLQRMVLQEVEQAVREYIFTGHSVRRMVVCGNSTMQHILLGISPENLSLPPYECQVKEMQVLDSHQLFEHMPQFPVIVMPNLSAFVGGDVVAGIMAVGLDQQENSMLIDLGTNGEIALSHEGVVYTTSVAAGPAFEGGNMQCGIPSIPGAICHIQMDGEEIEYQIIGQPRHAVTAYADAPLRPIGICGSGYMEGISELLIQGLVDDTGYMSQEVEIERDIHIVPADIRNFQLAKSAVRSGINILCQCAGLSFSQVEKVYIAGGFGKNSNLSALANLKIIPREFVTKTILLGNTALEGAIRMLLDMDLERAATVQKRNISVNLACEEKFTHEYMKNMMF